MSMNHPSLGLVMIVRDEEANLPRSLGPAARLFDEVVVADTGSRDDTPLLARSYGAKVLDFEWRGDFSQARNFCLANAFSDYLMWLDADNSVTAEDIALLRLLLNPDRSSLVWMTEHVTPQGEEFLQKRVFPKRPDVFFEGRVHEQLVHPAWLKPVFSGARVVHWGYAQPAQARLKGLRNLRLLEKMAQEEGEDFFLGYQLGKTLYNLRRFDEARNRLTRALEDRQAARLNRDLYGHAHVLLASCHRRLGRLDQAARIIRLLAARQPEYAPGAYELGRLLFESGELEEAADALERFLAIGRADRVSGVNHQALRFRAALMLGRCLDQTGQVAKARLAFELAQSLGPENPEPCLALAQLAWRVRRADEALDLAKRSLLLNPRNLRARALIEEIALAG